MDSRTKRLEDLLKTELDRLKVATEFERKKGIVFPETTQIVRDILRIEEMLERKGLEKKIAEVKAKKGADHAINLLKGL